MVATMWGKLAQSAFPSVKDDPERKEIATIVREWLQALDEGRATSEQFDGQITGRAMFLFCAMFGAHDPYYAVLCREIDRRKALEGMAFCRWRGWMPRDQIGAWRFDRAAERAAAPSKFDR